MDSCVKKTISRLNVSLSDSQISDLDKGPKSGGRHHLAFPLPPYLYSGSVEKESAREKEH